MSPFEASIVVEVFGQPRPELGVEWYDLLVCSATPAPVRALGGITITAPHRLDVAATADTVIVTGVADVHAQPDAAIVAMLVAAAANGARIVSICSGAFALAAAGLLDGLRATTHWQYAELLARRYPLVVVDPDVLYLVQGTVVTGAGSAAGIDVCLHLVRSDHGSAVANNVARRLVIAPHRDGGQAQFVAAPVATDSDGAQVARSIEWALAHLGEQLVLTQLAAVAGMSGRSFSRNFLRVTGQTPMRWLRAQRVQASLPLLEEGTASIEQIAGAVGFDSVSTFRQQFQAAMRTAPSSYRQAFRRATT